MSSIDDVTERLKAYIYPNTPATSAQESAFDDAVDAQKKFEDSMADEQQVPGGVSSFSVGNYSVSYRDVHTNQYTQMTLSPVAYAYLFNAGLIRHAMPVARRL